MNIENYNTEYKREYIDDIKKTIIAFANTTGGKIYIGIDDNLSVVGVYDADETLLKITNMARDSIKPDVTMFMNCNVETMEEKLVVVVEIQKGTCCPYYLGSKGIRPEGVFVRQGASSVPASETAILKMIKEMSGDNYETIRSIEQNLTFEFCKDEFLKANLKFEKEQMKTLNLIGSDGLYCNLATLLSEQCTHTIKVAVFQGVSKKVFKDRFEFSGSLFKQLRECFEFIDKYNRTHAEIDGLTRVDNFDYPKIAIREALLNAVVHREYSLSSSTLISIFDNRIEIVTVGGLLRGITFEDMLLGVSILRNKNLANIFYRLKLIEAYGTGVVKILESYEDYPNKKPVIETTDNAFKITLYNTNEIERLQDNKDRKIDKDKNENVELNSNERIIVDLCRERGFVVRNDVQCGLGISQTMATRYVNGLMEKGILVKEGKGKNVRYVCKN